MARAKPTHACFTFFVKPMHKHPHPFPIDMLRRDCCVPSTEEDAHKIARTHAYNSMRDESALVIGVVRFYPVGGAVDPTLGRWESFGWTMLSIAEVEQHTGTPVSPDDLRGYPVEVLRR